MTDLELRAAVAREVLGCWVDVSYDGYYICTCTDRKHGADSQTACLPNYLKDSSWLLHVAREAHRRFGLVVGAHETGRVICERALEAARARVVDEKIATALKAENERQETIRWNAASEPWRPALAVALRRIAEACREIADDTHVSPRWHFTQLEIAVNAAAAAVEEGR